jgi:acyl carrier protein
VRDAENAFVDPVLAIATRIAGPERTPPGAGPDTPLGHGGFRFDSVGLLELIVACEEAFGFTFVPEVDLTPEKLATVGSLAEVVGAKRGG